MDKGKIVKGVTAVWAVKKLVKGLVYALGFAAIVKVLRREPAPPSVARARGRQT